METVHTETMQLTVSDLINYLQQFDGKTHVFLHEQDAPEGEPTPFIALDYLVYSDVER